MGIYNWQLQPKVEPLTSAVTGKKMIGDLQRRGLNPQELISDENKSGVRMDQFGSLGGRTVVIDQNAIAPSDYGRRPSSGMDLSKIAAAAIDEALKQQAMRSAATQPAPPSDGIENFKRMLRGAKQRAQSRPQANPEVHGS
jgi:hypothetical protein